MEKCFCPLAFPVAIPVFVEPACSDRHFRTGIARIAKVLRLPIAFGFKKIWMIPSLPVLT